MKNNVTIERNKEGRRVAEVKIVKTIEENKSENQSAITDFKVESIEAAFAKSTFAAAGVLSWDHSKRMGVGPATNANTNHILMMKTKAIGKKALLKAFHMKESEIGVDKYIGLNKEKSEELAKTNRRYMSHGVEALITRLKVSQIGELLKEMRRADLNDKENIVKIFMDINAIYRLYQEKIIDAAKKLYKVEIHILLDAYRAMSLQKWIHEFDYTTKKLEISQIPYNKKGVELFADPIYELQCDLNLHVENNVNAIFDLEIEMSDEEMKRLLSYQGEGPVADLRTVVKVAYSALTAEHQARVNEIRALYLGNDEPVELIAVENKRYSYNLSKLKNLALQLLDGYSDEDAASIMQLLSCLDKKGQFNKRSGNQIATSLLPEKYLTMVLNTQAEVKVCGYRLAVDNGLKVGEEVEFINGVSNNGSILDFKNEIEYATGTFKIEMFEGSKYAVKDLAFNSPEADYNKRYFVVKSKSYKNLDTLLDALTINSTIVVDDMGAIKARGIKLAEVRGEMSGECSEFGNTIETLVNVRGTVSYVNIVDGDDKYGNTIMFELADVVELEEEEDIEIQDDLSGEGSTKLEVEGEEMEITDDLEEDNTSWDEEDLESELEDDEDWEDDFEEDLE